jgi:hypothetical protein
MDVHYLFCKIAMVDANGKVVGRERTATTIAALTPVLERVRRPRMLVIEEGPLAGYLSRRQRLALPTALSRVCRVEGKPADH